MIISGVWMIGTLKFHWLLTIFLMIALFIVVIFIEWLVGGVRPIRKNDNVDRKFHDYM